MSNPKAFIECGWIVLGLALGAVIGFAYFATLRRNVELYVTQKRFGAAVAVHVLRFAAVLAAFAFVVQLGLPALLGAFASFLLIRTVVMRRAKIW